MNMLQALTEHYARKRRQDQAENLRGSMENSGQEKDAAAALHERIVERIAEYFDNRHVSAGNWTAAESLLLDCREAIRALKS